MRKLIFTALFCITGMLTTKAQTTGDYQSSGPGNWSGISTWERYDGSNFIPTTIPPSSSDGIITIRNGHNVTIISAVIADEIVVNTGGTLTQNANLTLNDGTTDDLTVNGTWSWNGGVLSGPGSALVSLTAILNISSNNVHRFNIVTITNNGTIDWQNGNIDFIGSNVNSTLTNNGQFTISGNNTSSFNGARLNFANNGTFTKSSAGITNFTGINLFSNAGTFNVNAGILNFADANAGGTFSNTGIFNVTGATFTLNSGTYEHSSTTGITGTGSFNNNGTFNVNNELSFPATLVFATTGNINGAANLTINNDLAFQGNISGTGNFTLNGNQNSWIAGTLARPTTVPAGKTLNINSGNNHRFDKVTITNNGIIDWQNGNIDFIGSNVNSTLTNNGQFTISGNNTSSFNGARLDFANNGTFTKSNAGITNFTGINLFSNAGTFNVNAGILNFADANAGGTFSNTGIFNVTGATFTLNSGTYEHSSTTGITGTGSFNNNGTFNVTNDLSFPATLVFATTGNINGAANLTINNDLAFQGNISGTGNFTLNGNQNSWIAGTLARPTTVPAGKTLNINSGNNHRLDKVTITNNGTIDWQNGNIDFIGSNVNSTLTNNGQFTISGNNTSSFNGARLNFANNGTFTKSSSGITSFTGINLFTNAGTFNVNAGILNFADANAGGTFSNTGNIILNNSSFNSNAGSFNNLSNGALTGNGNYDFNSGYTNVGTIAPGLSPGILSINGQQPFSAASTLQIEMQNGSGAGTGHDQLTRTGSLTLAGTITVTETGTAPPGVYTIISASTSIDGNFSSVNLPAGYTLQVNSSTVTLTRAFVPQAYRSITSGNWSSASSWEIFNGSIFVPAAVAPAAVDGIITIRNGHNITISSPLSADEIIVEAGGTLTQSSTFTLENGNGDDLTVSGIWIFNAGSFKGPGNAVIGTTGSVSIAGGDNKFLEGASITNNGSINWSDGTIGCGTLPSVITNNNEFLITGNNEIQNVGSSCSLVNNGNLTKTSTGTTAFAGGNIAFTNTGTVNFNGGIISLYFSGPHSNTGVYSFNSGTLNNQTSTLNWNNGATLSGNGTLNNTGNIILNSSLTFPTGFVFTHTGSSNTISGIGDLTINDDFTYSAQIEGPGALIITGNLNWTEGSLSRAYTVPPGKTFSLTTNGQKNSNGYNITNNGTIDWQGGLLNYGTSPSSITNNGLFIISGNNDLYSGVPFSIVNNGSITKTSSGITQFGGGNVSIANIGSINGIGTLNFNITIFTGTGIIAPGSSPGLLTINNINGIQPLSTSSTLQIEIQDGSGAGTGHDQLQRNSNLTLAGTLNVTETGTVPNGVYTIVSLTSGTISGNFSTVDLPEGYSLQVNSNNVTVTKLVVPAAYRTIASGNWNNPAIWERHNGSAFVAAIVSPSNTDGSITIRNTHTVSINSNTTADEITVDAGGLLIVGTTFSLTLEDGNSDDLLVNGALNWLGRINSPGTVKIASTGTLNFIGTQTEIAANLINDGTIIQQEASIRFVSNPVIINNGSWTSTGTIVLSSANNGHLASFTNNGLFNRTSPFTVQMVGLQNFVNNGSINITGGGIITGETTATFTNTGSINLNANASMIMSFGTINLNNGSLFGGTGGNFNTNGLITLNADHNISSAINFTSTGTIDGPGNLILNRAFTIQGVIKGSGSFVVNANTTWNSGELSRPLTIDATRTMTLATAGIKLLGKNLVNNGTLSFAGSSIGFINSPTITNNKKWSASNGAGTYDAGSNGTVFNNDSLAFSGTIAFAGIDQFTNNSGAIIKGNNNLNATIDIANSFTNNGVIAPGLNIGSLTFNNQQPLSANSTLNIEMLNGGVAGTGYDQLRRNNDLTLAGTLTITETGIVPNGTYTIINLTAGAITGTFSTLNLPAGYSLNVNSSTVTVTKSCNLNAPVITANGPTDFCEGGSVTLSSSELMGNIWSNGETTQQITVNQTADYTVMTSLLGCVSASSLPVSVEALTNPTINTVSDQVVSNGQLLQPVVFTGNADLFSWTNTNPLIGLAASGTGNIPAFTAINQDVNATTATIIVTPVNTANALSCHGTSISFTITVTPTVSFDMDAVPNQVVCALTLSSNIVFTSTTADVSYNWTNSEPSISLAASGTGNIPAFLCQNSGTTAITATITVTPSISDGQGGSINGTPESFTITVNPLPRVNFTNNAFFCRESATDPIVFSGVASGYTWTNNNTSIGLPANGTGDIPSFIATNPFSSPMTATITVHAFTNDGVFCEGPTSENFSITINPKPIMNNVTNRTVCDGNTLVVNFSGVAVNQFTWIDNGDIIGLASAGTGNIGSTIFNLSSLPYTSNITVTPRFINTITCSGDPKNFTVTVNPRPTLDQVPTQRVCEGQAFDDINFISNVSGASFTWTNSIPGIGLAASGSGNIPSFVTTGTGNSQVTVQSSFAGCLGGTSNFSLIVDAAPVIAAINNQTVCANTTAGGIAVGGFDFSWTNTHPEIGLAATGNASGFLPPFNTQNTGLTPITATITLTPISANPGCSGVPVSFTITVNPSPSIEPIASQFYCNENPTNIIAFSGTVPGTNFSWTNNNTAIGLGDSGTGNIPSFNPSIISGTVDEIATIIVVPNYSNNGVTCASAGRDFTITIRPLPILNAISDKNVCNGSSTGIEFTSVNGLAGFYSWTNSNPSIGLPTGGTGNIQEFTAVNTGTVPVVATITVTPFRNLINNIDCAGQSSIFTITVYPTPMMNTLSNQTVCNGTSIDEIIFSGNVPTTVYEWTNDNTLIGLPASGTGNIPAFTGTNSGTSTLTAMILVRPMVYIDGSAACPGEVQVFTVTVKPNTVAPVITANGPTTFCGEGTVVLSTNIPGIWSAGGNSGSPTLFVNTAGTYFITNLGDGCGEAVSNSITVTINPRLQTSLSIAATATTICPGTNVTFTAIPVNGGTNPQYQWYVDGVPVGNNINTFSSSTLTGQATVECVVQSSEPCVTNGQMVSLVVVNVTSNLHAGVISGSNVFCIGSTATLTSSGDIGGVWSSSDPSVASVNPVTGFINALSGGYSTISYTLTNECNVSSSTSKILRVVSNAAPVVTGPVNICPFVGTNIPVTYYASLPGSRNFLWTIPPNVTIISGQNTDTIQVFFAAGFALQANKQIKVKESNGCSANSIAIYYLQSQLPGTPSQIIASANSICKSIGTNIPVSYTIPKVPGASNYIWLAQAGTTTITHPNGPGVNDTTVNVTFTSGFTNSSISVQAVNTCGTSGTRSLTIAITNPGTPGLISGPASTCNYQLPGGNNALYSVTATAGVTYSWTVPSGVTIFTGQGTNNISFKYPAGFATGIISVTATNGCGTSVARTKIVNTLYPATPSAIDVIQLQFCPNRIFSYTLASMPSNAQLLQWEVPPGATIINGQGTISIMVAYPNSSISGTIDVTAISNCRNSSTRKTKVKLPACAPAFTKSNTEATENGFKKESLPGISSNPFSVEIFPNPSSTLFNLKIESPIKEPVEIKVMDIQGRCLKIMTVSPLETTQLGASFKAGIYILEIKQDKIVTTRRLVKF